jgi:hypothetical protein
VQPLPEQFSRRQRPRRSARLARHLDRLAVVELQLCLQFLDAKSKLKAARCCRRLLQAADHPFAWKGPSVAVSTFNRPRLGSLIRQSLLRHAPIALTLDYRFDLPAAEVAAIPRLQMLKIASRISDDIAHQLLALPAVRGLQTLQMPLDLPPSTLQRLSTLPALHTLMCCVPDDSADESWLPAMPALTDLVVACEAFKPIPQSLIDAIGQCAQLRSLRLMYPTFPVGTFARLCSTPALHRLHHLELVIFPAQEVALPAEEYTAFSAFARLESLHLRCVYGVDRLLPHLAHVPTLRCLTVSCVADRPDMAASSGATHPGRDALHSLLAAAPRLEVRLEVPTSIEEWRAGFWYRHNPESHRQMDGQWRKLRRMAAENMERVAVVEPVLPVF